MKKIFTCLFLLCSQLCYSQYPDVKLPGHFTGWPNNYFTAGTGDGGTLSTYNVYLRLHYGLAIGSPYVSNGSGGYNEKTTISMDGRNGDLTTIGLISASNAMISGNLGIGTTNTGGNKLAVAGSVIAESVTVKLQGNWPDYVFKKNYQLPSLSAVRSFVTRHQHLPDVPSEMDVAKKGVDVGEMNKILLKKVEELTLYLIEKDNQLINQESRLKKIEKRLKTIKTN